MEAPSFFHPAYHSCTGYVARKLANSRIGNFQTEDRLTVRIAIYAARFFAQPLLWTAAIADIAFTAFLIPWGFLMTVMAYLLKATGCCYNELFFRIFKVCFIPSLLHIPQSISLLFLPLVGTIYALSGKIIPVKIKKSFLEFSPQTALGQFLRDEKPEIFTQLLSEMPPQKRMTAISTFFNIEKERLNPDLILPLTLQQKRREEKRKANLLVEFNFTHRFATRNAEHIRQLPRMHHLGIPMDISAMRIFQLMMQSDKGITTFIALRKFILISKDQVVRSTPEGVIIPKCNPCFASRYLYDQECNEEGVADEDRLRFSIRDLQLAIDAIKKDCSIILKRHLFQLSSGLQVIVRDYMIGEDPTDHFQLLRCPEEKEKFALELET